MNTSIYSYTHPPVSKEKEATPYIFLEDILNRLLIKLTREYWNYKYNGLDLVSQLNFHLLGIEFKLPQRLLFSCI